jgi:hypothetical protein
VDPPRADRRRRPGDPVELPDDDGGLEDRPGTRRRQHRRAQAQRHHAGDHPARRDRQPSSSRPACSTSSAATATPAGPRRAPHPADGLHHRLGARRHARWRRARPQTSSASTSSSAARRRSSSSTTPTSRRPPRASRSPATSTPARTARPPPACSSAPGVHDDFVAALADAKDNAKVGLPDDEDALFGPVNNANQLARVTGFLERCPATQRGRRRHRLVGWATATSSSPPSCRTCARTTR